MHYLLELFTVSKCAENFQIDRAYYFVEYWVARPWLVTGRSSDEFKVISTHGAVMDSSFLLRIGSDMVAEELRWGSDFGSLETWVERKVMAIFAG